MPVNAAAHTPGSCRLTSTGLWKATPATPGGSSSRTGRSTSSTTSWTTLPKPRSGDTRYRYRTSYFRARCPPNTRKARKTRMRGHWFIFPFDVGCWALDVGRSSLYGSLSRSNWPSISPRKIHGTTHGESRSKALSVELRGNLSRRSSESGDGSVVEPGAEYYHGYLSFRVLSCV